MSLYDTKFVKESNVDYMFSPVHADSESFFEGFIQRVANFVSSKQSESSIVSLQNIGPMYQFLANFGEFELYKETVIRNICEMDNSLQDCEIDICLNQIEHPKMYKYITTKLQQQQQQQRQRVDSKSTGQKSLILNPYNASDLWQHVQMYEHLTLVNAFKHQVDNGTTTGSSRRKSRRNICGIMWISYPQYIRKLSEELLFPVEVR